MCEQGRTGPRISPGTLTGLSVKLTGFAPLLLVLVAETRHCHAQRSSWSLARCCARKLKCFCSERTRLHPSCFHGLLAVPHGIFAPFLSNSFFFFFFFLCADFRQVTCTRCRVWSQQSRLTPRCDKGVYVKRCRAALGRFNASNNTLRRRRHPRPSFAFMLQTVDRAGSLLSRVKCVRCICPSASWPPAPVVPFSWNVVLNVTFFSCPSICSHTAFGKTKTARPPAPPTPQQPPLTMAIPITAAKSSCEKCKGQVPQRTGRQTHTRNPG